MDNFITAREIAKKWGITPRQVQHLCSDGKITGAVKFGNSWAIPADADRPADRRVTCGRYVSQGFTLIEMLMVIAIISTLVAIVIPTTTGRLERSREAVDMANVRTAYAQVATAGMLGENDASVSVALRQETDGWQTEDLSIGGITEGSPNWIGSPKAGGTCRVTFVNGAVQLNWGGYTTTLDKRWTVTSGSDGNKYLSATYGDYTDRYKASVVSEQYDAKQGNWFKVDASSSVSSVLDTGNFKYTVGYFVVDPNRTDDNGNNVILFDSGEKNILAGGSAFQLTGHKIEKGQELKVAVQFFKKNQSNKTVDLTQEEADALMSLISITKKAA